MKKYEKDKIGARMKSQYEDRTRYFIPRRTFVIVRLDGKSFHSYTKGLKRPFDEDLITDMDNAVIAIMSEIQGAKFAYCQSDEISILLTDFEKITTDAWFDGNIQKMASISASLMTAQFNNIRLRRELENIILEQDKCNLGRTSKNTDTLLSIEHFRLAHFDSRVFTIPDRTEVYNYFLWRHQDCSRNSISMVAQANFSHKELHGKSCSQMQDMLMSKGINWSELPEHHKNGRFIVRESYMKDDTERTRWVSKPGWKITAAPERLLSLIPNYEN